ncbi:entry exclusion lipoprotein TrbK [Legionella fairfieldensis]|uniref:entry exclusion lipoprotein TrbK n=1 Tax=Legionella fairfieldensis TaxID=45064 RepID=UPI000491AE61|nr:entry exclusion lipoprotein TrbK [Legionella fairfieldensis]
MNHLFLLALLTCLTTSCDNTHLDSKKLSCQSIPKNLSQAKQQAIADTCFRRGSFKKSAEKQW